MKRSNKKGFTIVELVIVIAVIAILASVLIPTIAGLVRDANISADTVLAKELNRVLAEEDAKDDASNSNFEAVLKTLRNRGYYIANLNARADECYFVWDDAAKQILLVDGKEEYKILYSNKEVSEKSNWYFAISDPVVADAVKDELKLDNDHVKSPVADVKELNNTINAAQGEVTIYVDENITIDKNNVIKVTNPEANITIELVDNKVTGDNGGTPTVDNIPFLFENGTINIVGGTVSATGDLYNADGVLINSIISNAGGTLNVKNTKFETSTSKTAILTHEGKSTTIYDNVTVKTGNNAIGAFGGAVVTVKNSNVDAEYLAYFCSNYAGDNQPLVSSTIVIDGGKHHTTVSNLLGVHGGTIEILGGEFDCDNAAKTFKFYSVEGSKIVIKGGTFNGTAFEYLTEDVLAGWVNNSDVTGGAVEIDFVDGAWVLQYVKA